METDANILAVAKAAIETFGADAATEMRKRAVAHEKAGESEAAEFWHRIACAIADQTPH